MAEKSSSGSSRPASSGSRPRKRRRKAGRIVLNIFKVLGTLVLIGIITASFLACIGAVYIKNVILPQISFDIGDYPMNLSSTIYYIDGETGEAVEYETLHGDQNRVWVEYSALPDHLIKAAVAIEDRRFYEHQGVDWLRTAKSVLTMFTGGKIQGGSTITQQLIKNTTQYDDVTVKRKVTEIFTALDFDRKYSKEKTLEYYLNYIYFGRRCYGVYTASYKYFGKDVSQLDLAECASLISITNNPSLYDPYTNLENNISRRCLVLDAMLRDGYITESECRAAKAEVIDFHSGQSDGQESTLYSWYTEQVITDVLADLMEQYGYSETVAKDILYSSGLKIYACVDPDVQAAVDSVYSDSANLPYTSAIGKPLQSAITVIDSSGNVVALAGKMGEKTSEDTRGYNRATRALRQPGSSIKPLAVYAPALEMGLVTPYSVLEDSPSFYLVNGQLRTSLGEDETGTAWPSNSNRRYLGQTTVYNALTNSTNTIAVRMLKLVTPVVSYEYLTEKFGLSTEHIVVSKEINGKVYSDLDYSQLALGGLTSGVTTLEMASAYSVFPRNGIYIEPRTYSRVEDSSGKLLLVKESDGEPVLKESTVYYVNEMLKNVVRSGTGTAANFSGMTIAGKTGTTTSKKDVWFVGYTPYYTAAVWIGYDSPTALPSDVSAPKLWKQVMSKVHEGLENKSFATPDGLVQIEYCRDTGLLATDECRNDIRGSRAVVGNVFREDVPSEYCEAHVSVEVCTADPILDSDGNPTGRYHLAGEFCPDAVTDEEGNTSLGRITVSVLDMDRQYVGEKAPEDNVYFLSAFEEAGTCTVHTEPIVEPPAPYDPTLFDITNPSTWPTAEQDPDFDPSDSSTWPNTGVSLPPLPEFPVEDPTPGEGETPIFTPPVIEDGTPENPGEVTGETGVTDDTTVQ